MVRESVLLGRRLLRRLVYHFLTSHLQRAEFITLISGLILSGSDYTMSTLYKVLFWGKIVGLGVGLVGKFFCSWNWRSFKTIIVSGEVCSQRFSASNQTLPACYKKVNALNCIYLQEVCLRYLKTKPSYSIRSTFPLRHLVYHFQLPLSDGRVRHVLASCRGCMSNSLVK